jgi:hypothetical protein
MGVVVFWAEALKLQPKVRARTAANKRVGWLIIG